MRPAHGVVLMGVGAVLVVVGIIGVLPSGDDNAPAEPVTTATAPVTTTASVATTVRPTTTSSEPTATSTTTTVPDTTTTIPPTTTTMPRTTTTMPTETVEAFIEAYTEAAEADDADFFFDRLHPVVLARTDADRCRAFIAANIVALEDYRLTGTIEGPRAVTFDTPTGTIAVDELYEAPVSFVFHGQSFEIVAAFAPVDGQMHWLTECE